MAMAEPSIFHNLEIDDGRDPSVQEFIENTLAALINELSRSPAEANISITLKRRASPIACIINPTNGALEASTRVDTYRKYSWPGKTAHEAWKFTAKGLVAGEFRLIRDSHVLIDAQSVTGDSLIPRTEDGDEIDISRIRWVLVIEKEAVFHRLARISYQTRALAGEGIMVTGKGYPDFMTRTFLRAMSDSVSNQSRRPPRFYALTDGDPHGMAIMSTYKYGSAAHLHQNARLSIPRLQWLGLRVTDIIAVPEVLGDTALLSLTKRDRKKIMAMLRNSPVWASDGPEPEWRAELQRMLVLNLKAEIEILYGCQGGLEGWINRRMFRQE
ncbi:unnamed protein product [Penicillium egyptiacum]|uniref:Topoisomerase 6 subunit A/Spo11 TOPRIM domain-containing protein n=1 Tax=Penicillium egyptiacum TaxID=1303716 RepID=A0A9W4KES6_9EURO|nr:unnamed protein product [Penicillium egyptiacum]